MISKARPSPGVGIERRHRLHGKVGQLAAIEILPHALVDARVGALQIEQRAHDVDVEALPGELRRGDDVVGQRQHHLGKLGVRELGVAQLLERVGLQHVLVADQTIGKTGQPALAALVGVVGFLERVDEAAQVVVGVVGDVGRHLRIAEVGLAGAMGEVRSARIRCVLPAPDWPWNSRMRACADEPRSFVTASSSSAELAARAVRGWPRRRRDRPATGRPPT